jgi:hypothetical protein
MRCGALSFGMLGVLAAAACARFGDGEGDEAPAPADGGIDSPTEGGLPDGSTDAPAFDGPDAGCESTFFCADFEIEPFPAPFDDAVQPNGGGGISLKSFGDSPARALRTTIPAATYPIGTAFYLRKKFSGVSASAVRFGFRVRVVSAPSGAATNTVQVATVGWGGEDSNKDRVSEIQTRIGPGIVLAKRDEPSDTHGMPLPMNANEWMVVRGQLAFVAGGTASVLVTVNGQATLQIPSFTSASVPSDFDIGVGGAGLDETQSTEIVYDIDDVFIDLTP